MLHVVTFSLEMHVRRKLTKISFQKKHSLLVALRKGDYEDVD